MVLQGEEIENANVIFTLGTVVETVGWKNGVVFMVGFEPAIKYTCCMLLRRRFCSVGANVLATTLLRVLSDLFCRFYMANPIP